MDLPDSAFDPEAGLGADTIVPPNISVVNFTQNLEESSASLVAAYIMDKRSNPSDMYGFILPPNMKAVDQAGFILEIFLSCYDRLQEETVSEQSIFRCDPETNPIIKKIKKLFRPLNLLIDIKKVECDQPSLYRDRNDYCFHLVPKPPVYLCTKGVTCVGSFRVITNYDIGQNFSTIDECSTFFTVKNPEYTVYLLRFRENNSVSIQ